MSGGTLTMAFKQPYGVFCSIGHMFKEVQLGDVYKMKMISRHASYPLSLA